MMKEYFLTRKRQRKIKKAWDADPWAIDMDTGFPKNHYEYANNVWKSLGKEIGFNPVTVRPSEKGERFFIAEPTNENEQ